MLQKFLPINAVLLNFLFIKEFQKKGISFHKNIKEHKIIIMFLEQQIIILEWFLKEHVTSNDAENSALHHRNNLHFMNIKI